MPDVVLNHQNILEIDTTPGGASPTWVRLHKGFSNLTQAINEVLYQASYLGDGGWGSTTVTGGQNTITLTGARIMGDAAQDYIFSDEVMYSFGKSRETTIRITRANGTKIEWDITLAKITDGGGDANNIDAITVEIHGNGKPRLISDPGAE